MSLQSRAREFGQAALVVLALCAVTACRNNPPPRGNAAGEPGSGGHAGMTGGAGSAGGAAEAGAGAAGTGAAGDGAGGAGSGGEGGAGGTPTQPNVNAILLGSCATTSKQSELLPSNLLFVIDRSSSMACNPPPTTGSTECELDPMRADPNAESKWQIMSNALLKAISVLNEETVVGISYFSNDDGCGVQTTPTVELDHLSKAQRGAIQASLLNVEPRGATPLVGAVILAYSHLHQLALDGAIRGKKFVVLLTDGEQSDACSDPMRCGDQKQCTDLLVDQEAKKAAGEGVGIGTFVIGVPGSEPARVVLSKLAQSGGTALPNCNPELGNCHFDMTTQENLDEALAEALADISGRALTCEMPMPAFMKDEVDPQRVNVVFTPSRREPEIVPQDARYLCDDARTNGWRYIEDRKKIRLCGPICKTVREDRGARLEVVLGCEVHGPT